MACDSKFQRQICLHRYEEKYLIDQYETLRHEVKNRQCEIGTLVFRSILPVTTMPESALVIRAKRCGKGACCGPSGMFYDSNQVIQFGSLQGFDYVIIPLEEWVHMMTAILGSLLDLSQIPDYCAQIWTLLGERGITLGGTYEISLECVITIMEAVFTHFGLDLGRDAAIYALTHYDGPIVNVLYTLIGENRLYYHDFDCIREKFPTVLIECPEDAETQPICLPELCLPEAKTSFKSLCHLEAHFAKRAAYILTYINQAKKLIEGLHETPLVSRNFQIRVPTDYTPTNAYLTVLFSPLRVVSGMGHLIQFGSTMGFNYVILPVGTGLVPYLAQLFMAFSHRANIEAYPIAQIEASLLSVLGELGITTGMHTITFEKLVPFIKAVMEKMVAKPEYAECPKKCFTVSESMVIFWLMTINNAGEVLAPFDWATVGPLLLPIFTAFHQL